jgi:hypothetical protein
MEKLKRNSILLLCLVILVGISCKNSNNKKQGRILDFKEQANLLTEGETDSLMIDLAKVADFNWERLYIFKPYTTIKTIDSTLGFTWDGADKSLINQSDEFNLLVFVENNAVIHTVKAPRNYGDFIRLKNSGPFYKNNATFILKKENYGQQKWLFFYEK